MLTLHILGFHSLFRTRRPRAGNLPIELYCSSFIDDPVSIATLLRDRRGASQGVYQAWYQYYMMQPQMPELPKSWFVSSFLGRSSVICWTSAEAHLNRLFIMSATLVQKVDVSRTRHSKRLRAGTLLIVVTPSRPWSLTGYRLSFLNSREALQEAFQAETKYSATQ